MSGSGGRAVDGLWTGGSCRNSMEGGYKVANFSEKKGALLLAFSGCGKKQVMYGI